MYAKGDVSKRALNFLEFHEHRCSESQTLQRNVNQFLSVLPTEIFKNRDIQGVSRLVDITAGGDFLGLCDKKSSYKHVSDFGRLRSYGHFLIPVHALV